MALRWYQLGDDGSLTGARWVRKTVGMPNDPMSGPPNRPRSTPIPDPDGRAPLPAPPTAAQFLDQYANVPWTPQPGPNVNVGLAGSTFSSGESTHTSSSGRIVAGLILLVSLGVVGLAMYVTTRPAKSAQTQISDLEPISTFTPPSFTIPEVITPLAAATSMPIMPLAAATSMPVLVIPTTPTIEGLATTLPTPPPVTDPAQPPTLSRSGPASLFEGDAARMVADQLELALAGDPTRLTTVYVFADYAIATAQDPENPGRLIGAYWRDGRVSDANITSTHSGGDLGSQLFTEGEVNWDAIAVLVAEAPGLLTLADGQVSYVAVQRIGIGNPPPIVIDVYVEGSSRSGYVEASASGVVLSVNNS